MKTISILRRSAAAGLVLAVAGSLAAQTAPSPPSARTPAFRFSFTERIRQESSDNVTSLDEAAADSSAYVRFRTSLAALWRVVPGLELDVRLTNENRFYLAPKSDPRIGKDYDLHEIFFDHLNLKWRNQAGLPWTVTLGRQDIQMGEGFVIFDGGPLDGSRSAYFNAARLDWALDPWTTLTGFYLYQPRTDTVLPRLRDMSQKMVEQDEEGFGLYLVGAPDPWGYEGYVFRKNVRGLGELPGSRIDVFGGRFRIPFSDRLTLMTEAAVQSGRLGSLPRRGFGGYFHLDLKTGGRLPLPGLLTLGGVHLSGDDPATDDRYEGWDPAFGRWPKWSESQIYLFGRESKPSFWTNWASLYGTVVFDLAPEAKLLLTWHRLRAPALSEPSILLSGRGKDRGNLAVARLNYDVSKNLSGHLIWEHFLPGDYYFPGARSYAWVRFELMIRY